MRFNLLHSLVSRAGKPKRPSQRRWRPRLESLEARQMLTATLWVNPLNPGDYPTIQAAVDAATPGDFINVAPGTYSESVSVVTKNLTITGGKPRGAQTSGASVVESDTVAFLLDADNVALQKFTIQPATATQIGTGIQTGTTHSGYKILNNIIQNEDFGIELDNSLAPKTYTTTVSGNQFITNVVGVRTFTQLKNAAISGNNFTGNLNLSIALYNATGVQITGNQIINDASIQLGNSTALKVSGNTITNPRDSGIVLGGGVTNSEISKNSLQTSLADSPTPPASLNGIDVIQTSLSSNENTGNKILSNTINRFNIGILVDSASKNTLSGNIITNSLLAGISLNNANQNIVTSNSSKSNLGQGIEVIGDKNTVTANNASNNAFEGIEVTGDYNAVCNNTATYNQSEGIDVSGDWNNVSGNNASYNLEQGIILVGNTSLIASNTANSNLLEGIGIVGTLNVLSRNSATRNSEEGIEILGDANSVMSNSACNNTEQGIRVFGEREIINGNTANGNLLSGIELMGDLSNVSSNYANTNKEDGIRVFGNGNTVASNSTASNFGSGIVVGGDNNKITSNSSSKNTVDGILLLDVSTGNTISGNNASNNGNDGIEVEALATGNTITKNTAKGNKIFDLQDDSGTATNNTWKSNTATKRSPSNLG
jgi:parallel beta-helix repeat protein